MPRSYNKIKKHFSNKVNTLKKMLDKELKKELIDIGEKTVNKIKRFLDKNWYNTYTPKDYERTDSLKNAVRYTIKGNKLRIYFDRRYFARRIVNGGEGWQPHRGFDGETFIDGLIDFLNDGTGNGGISTNPRRNDGNLGLIDYAEEVVNEYVDKIVDKKIEAIVKKYL